MNAFCRCGIGDKLSVFGSQVTMAEPNHTVRLHTAAPNRTTFGPALWCAKNSLKKSFRYPPVVSRQRQVDVNQRVSRRESLPGGRHAAVAVNDPLTLPQEPGVRP